MLIALVPKLLLSVRRDFERLRTGLLGSSGLVFLVLASMGALT